MVFVTREGGGGSYESSKTGFSFWFHEQPSRGICSNAGLNREHKLLGKIEAEWRKHYGRWLEQDPRKTIENPKPYPKLAYFLLFSDEGLSSSMFLTGGRLTTFCTLNKVKVEFVIPLQILDAFLVKPATFRRGKELLPPTKFNFKDFTSNSRKYQMSMVVS